jgi:peroxidase
MRAAYGLPAVTSFAQITSNVAVQQKLQQLYGTVNNIDAFVGALAEDHVAGADVGPLTRAVLADQFTRLRDGDRFFYLNQFSGKQLSDLLATTSLTKVIERNSGVTNLQANAFYFQSSISGTVTAVSRTNRRAVPHGLAGVTVQLWDADGKLVATAVTDAQGRYRFDDLHGVNDTGDTTVRLVVPAGDTLTSPGAVTTLISRGDVNATVNFGLADGSGGSGWGDPIDGWSLGTDQGHHSGRG